MFKLKAFELDFKSIDATLYGNDSGDYTGFRLGNMSGLPSTQAAITYLVDERSTLAAVIEFIFPMEALSMP